MLIAGNACRSTVILGRGAGYVSGEKMRTTRAGAAIDLICGCAAARAASYRQQAAEFREMAETESDQMLCEDFRALAAKYDALAEDIATRD